MFRRAFAAILVLPLLGACSAVSEPYYVGRWQTGDNGKMETGLGLPQNDTVTGRPNFSVCYSSMLHSAAQVRALVQKHCGDARLTANVTDLYTCSTMAPVRATYSCSALSRTAEEARPNLLRTDSSLGTINLY